MREFLICGFTQEGSAEDAEDEIEEENSSSDEEEEAELPPPVINLWLP